MQTRRLAHDDMAGHVDALHGVAHDPPEQVITVACEVPRAALTADTLEDAVELRLATAGTRHGSTASSQ